MPDRVSSSRLSTVSCSDGFLFLATRDSAPNTGQWHM